MAEAARPASRWERMRAWQRWTVIGAAIVFAVVFALGAHTIARHNGWFTERMTPAALATMLEPYYRISKPDGAGPFPAALLYSGCDGPANNLDLWSEALLDAGYVTIVVDSHTPRDLLNYEAWRLVCAGQLLPGTERSGDVLVSLAYAADLADVDPDRLTLIGMSHGGWSIMDLLTRDIHDEPPINLTRLEEEAADRALNGVEAVILVYPWCGLASRARHFAWTNNAPVLFLLARFDTIAPSFECELIARSLEEDGRHVETLIFRDATHGYDQKHRSTISPLRFDAEATSTSIERAIQFMQAAGAGD